MATVFDTSRRRAGDDLAAVIPDFLHAAEAGAASDAAGLRYSPAALRSLRRTLGPVEMVLGGVELRDVDHTDRAALEALASRVVEHDGLPPIRLEPTVEALRAVLVYSGWQRPAEPRRHDPSALLADPPRWEDRAGPRGRERSARRRPAASPRRQRPAEPAREPEPNQADDARTPTFTMLALGAQVGVWIERIVVIAFILTAIGLALEFT